MSGRTSRLFSLAPAVWVIVVFTAAYVAEISAIEVLNGGHLTYSLDDGYIHLALAEGIAHGHYGINPTEFSAPSSSILWPFLLVPFAWLGVELYAPLLISYLACIGTLLIFLRIIEAALASTSIERRQTIALLATLAMIPATNLLGLAFTGLEHCLQVFLAVALAYGLIETERSGTSPGWLPFAVWLGPLVRYENLALSLPALVYLMWRRQYRASLVTGGMLLAVLVSFSAFLHSHGLDALPSSVVAKSGPIHAGAQLSAIVQNLKQNIAYRQGVLLSLALLPLLAVAGNSSRDRRDRVLALWLSSAIGIHLVLGGFGEFFRYELYLWAVSLLIAIYLSRDLLARFVERASPASLALSLSGFLAIACTPYLYATLVTPLAANNIYDQQYQMHVFANDYYREPVAVNDIGLVSYRNARYTLDLFGLADPDAVRMRHSDPSGQWLADLAAKRNVHLAMIYDSWFPKTPASWVLVGRLMLGRPRITPDDRSVSFYATDRATASALAPMLRRFAAHLPDGAQFTPVIRATQISTP